MAIEEQINRLAREFKTFGTKLESIEEKLTTVEDQAKAAQGLLESTHALATQTHALATQTHALANRTHVLLEDTNAVAKLGLEGLQGLRESMDDKLAAAAKHGAEQTELLKALFVHVRKRVERIERPKRRRRP